MVRLQDMNKNNLLESNFKKITSSEVEAITGTSSSSQTPPYDYDEINAPLPTQLQNQ